MKFILTRHTTTEWNSIGRIQGQTDIPLSEQGKIEAKQLGKVLSGLGINFIVSSDLKRARETAEIVNTFLSVPLQLETKLRECSFGEIEGMTKQQAMEKCGSFMVPNWDDQDPTYDFRPFGGEHRDGVLMRHLEVLEALKNEKPNSLVLLVGHGRGMRTLLVGLGYPYDFRQGEYKIIDYNSG